MLTPKQLRQLAEILSCEEIGTTPSLEVYAANAVNGDTTQISPFLWVSRNGRLEASQPQGPKAFVNRLKVRAIVRTLTRAARAGIPVGERTQGWMLQVLRADDMAREAKEVLAKH